MEAVVVDTDVVSFSMRRDSRARPYEKFLANCVPCVSFMTIAEMRFGAELARWGAKRLEAMEQALKHYTVLPLDDATSREFARVGAEQYRNGRNQLNRSDWWIAATAKSRGLRVLTHNARHFEGIDGLSVVTFAKVEGS